MLPQTKIWEGRRNISDRVFKGPNEDFRWLIETLDESFQIQNNYSKRSLNRICNGHRIILMLRPRCPCDDCYKYHLERIYCICSPLSPKRIFWKEEQKDEMRICEALFKGVSSQFGARTIEKCFTNIVASKKVALSGLG